MRLVTRKIYRAFPQLDAFSDEQCRLYVRRVRLSMAYRLLEIVLAIAAFLALLVAIPIAVVIGSSVVDAIEASVVGILLGMLVATIIVTVPVALALRTRDWLLWRLIGRQIGKARCLRCGYSLLGQRIIEGVITCPECGQRTTLSDLGLQSAEDLIPPPAGA